MSTWGSWRAQTVSVQAALGTEGGEDPVASGLAEEGKSPRSSGVLPWENVVCP